MTFTVHHRLLGLLALCTLACAVPATMLTLDRLDVVATARLEQQGLPPARALLSTVRLVQQHRGLSAVMLGGDESAGAQRAAKKLEIDATIERLDALVRAGSALDSRLSRSWQRDLADWKALQQAVAERQLNGTQSSARHTAVIAGLLRTLSELNDHWALSFEPRPEAHFLVIGSLQDAPAMIELMGQTRARGANLLAAKTAPEPAEKARFESLQVRLQAAFGTMRTTLDKSVAVNAGGKQQLEQAVGKLGELGQSGIKLAQDHVLAPEVPSYASADYYKQTTAVIDGMYDALDSVLGVLEQELQASASRAIASAAGALVAVLLLLGLAIANGLLTARRIRRELGAEPTELSQLAQRVRDGDLRVQQHAGAQPDSVMAALQAMQGQLARTVVMVRHNAESVAAASTQIAQGNHDLSNRTELQASSLQQTASTMEELGTTVRHNADGSQKADQLAREAAAVAGQGGAVVAQVVQTMQGINESARRIADITGVIDGIAFQTNILALNAAVEAARAGEQGRGFAVVASEVRSLAQRSADAAREIKSLIGASVERVEAGSLQAAQAGRTMDQVVQAVHGVSAVIGEISQASQQQSSGVQQVGEAVVALDRGTQQNAALVEQTAAAAQSLQQQARHLVEAVSVFQVQGQPA